MADKKNREKEKCKQNFCNCGPHKCGTAGAVYGLGFVGAAIYYVSISTSFGMGVLGVLKAIVWPAFLVYGALKSLGI